MVCQRPHVHHFVKESKRCTPIYHPQLKDHHLVRADTQRGASSEPRAAFRKDVLTRQNTSGTKGWCCELNGDSPPPQKYTHTKSLEPMSVSISRRGVFADVVKLRI